MSAPGEEIGLARVYDFALESGSYNTSNSNINEYDISLYDIQTFTKITLKVSKKLTKPLSNISLIILKLQIEQRFFKKNILVCQVQHQILNVNNNCH